MSSAVIRAILLVLAMAGMGMRAVAPPGYMLSAEGGRVAITLCNGGTASVDFGKSHDKRTSDVAPCAFAAVAQASAPQETALSTPVLNAAFVEGVAFAPARVGEGLAAPPPPATGPPLPA